MGAINYQEQIDFYLEKNGLIELSRTDKERVKKLKDIIFIEKVNLDYYDLKRQNNQLTSDEYLDLLHKSRINIYDAVSYIAIIKEVAKEEKIAKRRQSFQKIKSIFKRKK